RAPTPVGSRSLSTPGSRRRACVSSGKRPTSRSTDDRPTFGPLRGTPSAPCGERTHEGRYPSWPAADRVPAPQGGTHVIIGVPKETKTREYRVGMNPGGVRLLVDAGHQVLVETTAGDGSGITDEQFVRAGATIVESAADAWSAE